MPDRADDPGREPGDDGADASWSDADPQARAVLDALADHDPRRLLAALDEPRTADEVVERCDVARTSAFDARLAGDGPARDEHDGGEEGKGDDDPDVDAPRTVDERLASDWSQVGDEP
jgi:hypothetical protein